MVATGGSLDVVAGAPAPAHRGWTGAQFSVWRALLGLGLLHTFLDYPLDLPSLEAPVPFAYVGPLVLVAGGVALSLGLLAGAWGRWPPALLVLLWGGARLLAGLVPGLEAALLDRHLLLLPVLVFVVLLAPPAPYLSWDAAGRPDPGGGWRLGSTPRIAAGLLLVLLLLGWGLGLDLPRTQPGAVLLVLALVVDPGWLPPRRLDGPSLVFFDGSCGLCHRTVRFALAEEPGGGGLRFAPLEGSTFAEQVPAERRATLPDSIVVRTPDGALLQKGDAVLHVGARLGGLWRALAGLARTVPRPLRDGLYDLVARVRRRLFARPEQACPIVPPHLAERFLP